MDIELIVFAHPHIVHILRRYLSMTPTDAATLLVELYGRYRHSNSADPKYERAIALACSALQHTVPEAIIPLHTSVFAKGGIKE